MGAEQLKKLMEQKTKTKSKNLLKSKTNREDKNSILVLKLEDIVLDPEQVRKVFDKEKLQELAKTIVSQGQRTPIEVASLYDGKYKLVTGERRFRSIRDYTDLEVIRAIHYTGEKKDKILDQFIENEQREGLNPFEIAYSLDEIKKDQKLKTNSALAEKIGKNESYAFKHMKLLDLPKEIVDDYYSNKRSFGISILYAIAKMKTEKEMIDSYYAYINNDTSRDELERKTVKTKKEPKKKITVLEKTTNTVMKNFKISGKDKINFQKELKILVTKYTGSDTFE